MKRSIIIVLFFSSFLILNAQVKELQIKNEETQHSLTMFYGKLSNDGINTVFFIDGKQASYMELLTINSKFIDSVSVEKKPIRINNKEYQEQMYIVTKDNYNPKKISLKDIRKKYAKVQNIACIYFIDGRLVKVDDTCIFLDENNILEICCHQLDNVEENVKLNIIEIFTRSDENLKKANDIIIR